TKMITMRKITEILIREIPVPEIMIPAGMTAPVLKTGTAETIRGRIPVTVRERMQEEIHPEKRMTAHITGKRQNNRRLMRRTFLVCRFFSGLFDINRV